MHSYWPNPGRPNFHYRGRSGPPLSKPTLEDQKGSCLCQLLKHSILRLSFLEYSHWCQVQGEEEKSTELSWRGVLSGLPGVVSRGVEGGWVPHQCLPDLPDFPSGTEFYSWCQSACGAETQTRRNIAGSVRQKVTFLRPCCWDLQ